MYTGWLQPFRRKGPLTQQERDTALPRARQPDIEPHQRIALIHFNSTYIDWIDRRFAFRGAAPMVFFTIIGALVAVVFFKFIIFSPFKGIDNAVDWITDFSIRLASLCLIFLLFRLILFREYFAYTYFPIRFNRKTRMVHVFRHNGPGGVLSVPWDKVFFHIGQGTTRKDFLDIRGEVLDGDVVKDTFALGHVNSQRALLEMWEFIRRYMDEGPEAAGPHPLDRYVELSVTPSWTNCFLATRTYYAAGLPPPFQTLVMPFVLLYTLTRWGVLHTCRKPVFPPEIEATCKVDPNDPNVWPIPESSGEFAATLPGILERAEAKRRQQRAGVRRNLEAKRQAQSKPPLQPLSYECMSEPYTQRPHTMTPIKASQRFVFENPNFTVIAIAIVVSIILIMAPLSVALIFFDAEPMTLFFSLFIGLSALVIFYATISEFKKKTEILVFGNSDIQSRIYGKIPYSDITTYRASHQSGDKELIITSRKKKMRFIFETSTMFEQAVSAFESRIEQYASMPSTKSALTIKKKPDPFASKFAMIITMTGIVVYMAVLFSPMHSAMKISLLAMLSPFWIRTLRARSKVSDTPSKEIQRS